MNNDGHHGGEGEDINKYFSDGLPLATSCNDKPCEFEDEFPWNSVRLPSFIKPIRYDIELTPNLTTMVVKGNIFTKHVNCNSTTLYMICYIKCLN